MSTVVKALIVLAIGAVLFVCTLRLVASASDRRALDDDDEAGA